MVVFNIKTVFLIFLFFQTTFLTFNDDDDDESYKEINQIRNKLEKIFDYPFYLAEPLHVYMARTFGQKCEDSYVLDDVAVWKIVESQQTFKPEDYNNNGFIEFGSNETFLIFTKVNVEQSSDLPETKHYTVYYWVGNDTTLEQKKNVAKYAAMFFTLMSRYLSNKGDSVNFTREDQIFESESFIHTLNYLRSTPQPEDGRNGKYVNKSFPLNGPNLYIVKNGQTRGIIKVPLGLGPWLLIQNTCLVVEVPPYLKELYPVTTFFGSDSDDATRMIAILFAQNIKRVTDMQTYLKVITQVNLTGKFKALIEVLENKHYYRPSETKYIESTNTLIRVQDGGILFFKIAMTNVEGQQIITRTEITQRPLAFDIDDPSDNYILDSKSIAGIFFIHGANINIKRLICSIQNAEEYLHYETLSLARPIRMRISNIELGQAYIDVMMHEEPQEGDNDLLM